LPLNGITLGQAYVFDYNNRMITLTNIFFKKLINHINGFTTLSIKRCPLYNVILDTILLADKDMRFLDFYYQKFFSVFLETVEVQ
jgi:hypothetical protein